MITPHLIFVITCNRYVNKIDLKLKKTKQRGHIPLVECCVSFSEKGPCDISIKSAIIHNIKEIGHLNYLQSLWSSIMSEIILSQVL